MKSGKKRVKKERGRIGGGRERERSEGEGRRG